MKPLAPCQKPLSRKMIRRKSATKGVISRLIFLFRVGFARASGGWDQQHGERRLTHAALGHAAENQPLETASSVRAHHDQVGAVRLLPR
jgi:hypothetical protein